jgi:hypothetical protein
MKRFFFAAIALALLFAGEAVADMPQLLSYQGVLADASGTAVSDGTYSITFRLYTAPSGGSPVWEENNPSVQVAKGIFNATLGTTVGLSGLPFDATYYVGISVAGEAELTPRQLLTAVPYSFNAKAVMGTANEFPSSGNVGIGTISPGYPLHIQSSDIRPLRIDGTAAGAWADISLNAAGANSNPCIELLRGGSSKAELYINSVNDLKLRQAGAITLTSEDVTGNLGVGTENPLEKLHVGGGVLIGTTANTNAGTLRWTGSDFEGYDGASWKSLTATGDGGPPPGTTGQTLWYNGSEWAATSSLYNDGSRIGIGTVTPGTHLDIYGTNVQDAMVETGTATGKASLILKSTAGSLDYLELDKHGPSAGGTTAGSIPLANLSRVTSGSLAGPLMLQVVSANPLYFVTSNLERMRLDASGNLGINTTSPGAKLHVDGNQWDLTNTEGDFKIGDATYRLKFGVATGGGGAGTAGIRAAGGAQKLILGGGTAEVLSVDGAGNTNIGGATSNAKLRLYRSGVDSAMVLANTNAYGGSIVLYDEGHATLGVLQADVNGEGGYLSVYRNASGSQGLAVDGNYNGTNDPRITIQGATRSALFRMDQADDGSVLLPANAIGSSEILDEPGAASYTEGGASGVTIPVGGYTTIGSRSITVPDAGYVLVIATGQAQAAHSNGTTSSCNFGVSDDPAALPPNQDVNIGIPSAAVTGAYNIPTTVHGLFSVAAGTYTYYFIGNGASGAFYCFDTQLTLLYIPTAYGTVTPTLAGISADAIDSGTRPGLTSAEIASERVRSEADNASRIERELAEMRDRIETLEREARNQ